ncbi:hypothetical protein [Helicovermis profundi]|uniref:Activator of Hsp90 ATPase N-terminal domain-containing protein n=1 Tax=Helicovermis profundi TaxID=3065157 RepID=A0AAU9E5S5_9FIRM|nr:hypothetical protein HLPR_23870 [Clostridia bacterium S502]
MFIHKSVRLSGDAIKAYRYFSVSSLASKWLNEEIQISLKNKTFDFKNRIIKSTAIASYKREKNLSINIETYNGNKTLVEFSFMKCGPNTEFCTEIHLIQKEFEETKDQDTINFFSKFWDEKLDALREIFNKEWIIEDDDISLPYFKGSKL